MNKQIFLSLTLVMLVGFSTVMRAEESKESVSIETPIGDAKVEQKVEEKSNVDSRVNVVWKSINDFCHEHKFAFKVSGVGLVLTYATHKIMYIQCPWYRNWVDGIAEDSKMNPLPWTN